MGTDRPAARRILETALYGPDIPDWPAGGHSVYFRDPAGNSVELAVPPVWGLEDD